MVGFVSPNSSYSNFLRGLRSEEEEEEEPEPLQLSSTCVHLKDISTCTVRSRLSALSANTPQHSRACFGSTEGPIFFATLCIQEFVRESSKRTLALDLPEVKALWVKGGKSLLLDLRPARADPVFKSRLDSRKRKETYELKNRAVGANTAAAAAAAAGLSGK